MQDTTTKSHVEKALLKVRREYGVHGRPFTEEDFYLIAEGEGIQLVTPKLLTDPSIAQIESLGGWYARFKFQDLKFIYLRSFYIGPLDLFVAFHELGHHFLKHRYGTMDEALDAHTPGSLHYQDERDADAFAALATGEVRDA